jgi:hypothetical protein
VVRALEQEEEGESSNLAMSKELTVQKDAAQWLSGGGLLRV